MFTTYETDSNSFRDITELWEEAANDGKNLSLKVTPGLYDLPNWGCITRICADSYITLNGEPCELS